MSSLRQADFLTHAAAWALDTAGDDDAARTAIATGLAECAQGDAWRSRGLLGATDLLVLLGTGGIYPRRFRQLCRTEKFDPVGDAPLSLLAPVDHDEILAEGTTVDFRGLPPWALCALVPWLVLPGAPLSRAIQTPATQQSLLEALDAGECDALAGVRAALDSKDSDLLHTELLRAAVHTDGLLAWLPGEMALCIGQLEQLGPDSGELQASVPAFRSEALTTVLALAVSDWDQQAFTAHVERKAPGHTVYRTLRAAMDQPLFGTDMLPLLIVRCVLSSDWKGECPGCDRALTRPREGLPDGEWAAFLRAWAVAASTRNEPDSESTKRLVESLESFEACRQQHPGAAVSPVRNRLLADTVLQWLAALPAVKASETVAASSEPQADSHQYTALLEAVGQGDADAVPEAVNAAVAGLGGSLLPGLVGWLLRKHGGLAFRRWSLLASKQLFWDRGSLLAIVRHARDRPDGGLFDTLGDDQLADIAKAMVVPKYRGTLPPDGFLLGLPWRAGHRLVRALAGVYPRVYRPPSLPLICSVEGFVGTLPVTPPAGRCLVAYMAFRAGDGSPAWGIRRLQTTGIDADGQVAWALATDTASAKPLLDGKYFKDYSELSIGGARDENGLDPLGAACVSDVVKQGLVAINAVESPDVLEELMRGKDGTPFRYWGCLDLQQIHWTPRLVGLALRLRSSVIRALALTPTGGAGLVRFAKAIASMTANRAVALDVDRHILSLPWEWASAVVKAIAELPGSKTQLLTVAGWKGGELPEELKHVPLAVVAFEALRPADGSALAAGERLTFQTSKRAEDQQAERRLHATVSRVVSWAKARQDSGDETHRQGRRHGKRPHEGQHDRRSAATGTRSSLSPPTSVAAASADGQPEVRVMTYNVEASASATGCAFSVVKTIADAVQDGGVGIVCLQGSTRALEGQLLSVHSFLAAERLVPQGPSLAVLFDGREFALLTQAQLTGAAGFGSVLCVALAHRSSGRRLCIVNISRAGANAGSGPRQNQNQGRLGVDLQRLTDRLQRELLSGPGAADMAFVVCGDFNQRVDRALLGGRWEVANTGKFLTSQRNGVLGAFDNVLAGNGAKILRAESPAGYNYGAMIRKPLDRFAQPCGDHLPLAACVSLSGQSKRQREQQSR